MVKTSLPLPKIPSKIFNATSKHETPVIREQCEIVQKWLVLYGESGIRVRPSCNLLIIDTSEGAILYHTMPYYIVDMSEGSIPHHTMHTTPGPYHTIVDTSEGRQLPGHPALGLPILMINSSMLQKEGWSRFRREKMFRNWTFCPLSQGSRWTMGEGEFFCKTLLNFQLFRNF